MARARSLFRTASTVRVKYAMLVRSLMPRQVGVKPGRQEQGWDFEAMTIG